MSRIEGFEQFRSRLKLFEDDVAANVGAACEAEIRAMQIEAADLVPVDTGDGREALLMPEALRVEKSPDGNGKRFVYGFLTDRMKKKGFHLFWVEFGTKGYLAGQRRVTGKSKTGRIKDRKVKRNVPPRPAQPFWRPAEANMWRRLQSRLDMQRLVSIAKRVATNGGGS